MDCSIKFISLKIKISLLTKVPDTKSFKIKTHHIYFNLYFTLNFWVKSILICINSRHRMCLSEHFLKIQKQNRNYIPALCCQLFHIISSFLTSILNCLLLCIFLISHVINWIILEVAKILCFCGQDLEGHEPMRQNMTSSILKAWEYHTNFWHWQNSYIV